MIDSELMHSLQETLKR